jgi:hypothetical protein
MGIVDPFCLQPETNATAVEIRDATTAIIAKPEPEFYNPHKIHY